MLEEDEAVDEHLLEVEAGLGDALFSKGKKGGDEVSLMV